MRFERLFFIVLFVGAYGYMPHLSVCFAQEDNVTTAADGLQHVLSSLKESVEKLDVDNGRLTSEDESIRTQVVGLQMQLGHLKAQGDVLNSAADKLRAPNPRRSQQIERLEGENAEVDASLQHAQNGIKLAQQSLDSGYQEDQKLLLQLKGLTNDSSVISDVPSEAPLADVRLQKEKLRLLKMIYDCQQRQEALHGSILETQKNAPLVPAASAMAHQQLLKEQIKELEDQIGQYPVQKTGFGSMDQWNDNQLGQLESELKALERNYDQLKDLTGKMSQKAKMTRMTVPQQVEGEKLQNSIDDLNRQSEGLKASLDDLRSQMVDLDKRKSYLEIMIKHL